MNLIKFIISIDDDSRLAGTICIAMISAVILVCVLAFVIKRLLLKRKYKSDDEYVKNYKKQLKEREKEPENKKARELKEEDI